MNVETVFALTGAIIILGFVGNYLFKRFKIPDILILMLFGFILGPFFNIINPEIITPVSEIFISLALLTILFDGGLHLNLYKVFEESPKASLLAIFGVLMSMILTAGFTYFLFNWDILHGLLLGSIIGGSSSPIVISLIRKIKVPEKVITLLSLESALTDAITIILGITFIQLITSPMGANIQNVFGEIASAFSVGFVMGLILGIIWIRILRLIKGEIYEDILTLSIVILFYSLTQSLGGNGAIFALTFGIILGNGIQISKIFRMKNGVEASEIMKKFQAQITFFIRTFFFVYLGLIISFTEGFSILIYGIILTLILIVGRFSLVWLASIKSSFFKENEKIIGIMVPRGLSAAVLAQLIVISGIPNASIYLNMVIIVIVLTVIISTLGILVFEKKSEKPADLNGSILEEPVEESPE